MSPIFTPFLLVAVTLPVLLLSQRWLHNHLRGLALLLTGKMELAVVAYALVLFPGVLLHELSHWVTAVLLGVRTGAISLVPRLQEDGSVQLGYVEYYKGRSVGALRESLIGAAPLISGTAVTWFIAARIFGVSNLAVAVQSGNVDELALALDQVFQTNDIFVWLYLLFAVSNAMMPSPSDRRAWPAFLWLLGTAGIVLYVLDLQHVLWRGLAGPVATVFGYVGAAFALTLGVNAVVMGLIAAGEHVVSRLRGVELVYGAPPE